MRKSLLILASALLFQGCLAQVVIPSAISKYESVASQIELGDSKSKVLSLLEPSQQGLDNRYRKRPEKYISDGKKIDIYFFRSAWQSDGLTTEDEFTPYTFVDDKLVAIGWSALGGAKTQGQAVPGNTYNFNSINRANQQILNHGTGGCTPNFSTGGCL